MSDFEKVQHVTDVFLVTLEFIWSPRPNQTVVAEHNCHSAE